MNSGLQNNCWWTKWGWTTLGWAKHCNSREIYDINWLYNCTPIVSYVMDQIKEARQGFLELPFKRGHKIIQKSARTWWCSIDYGKQRPLQFMGGCSTPQKRMDKTYQATKGLKCHQYRCKSSTSSTSQPFPLRPKCSIDTDSWSIFPCSMRCYMMLRLCRFQSCYLRNERMLHSFHICSYS